MEEIKRKGKVTLVVKPYQTYTNVEKHINTVVKEYQHPVPVKLVLKPHFKAYQRS